MSYRFRVFYCWLCACKRRFTFAEDSDGGNWHGSCGHALWSERQHTAQLKADPEYRQ